MAYYGSRCFAFGIGTDGLQSRCSQDAANIFATEVNTLSAWMLLTDEQVTNMVKTTRRPGGTVAATTGDGTVPDPGVKVTGQTEENLKRWW